MGNERRCAHCEYFDGGGIKPDGEPIESTGDCLMPYSGRFQTPANGFCTMFVRASDECE